MSCYVSSNNNRFYVGPEASYGTVPAITAEHRIPAVKLKAKQTALTADRKDKTGGRTFQGIPTGTRKRTTFELKTYLTGWADGSDAPSYGPLFQAAMGNAPQLFTGATLTATPTPTRLQFSAPHGLTPGQAVAFGGEIRFVIAVISSTVVEVNAAFSIQPTAGSPMGNSITYRLGKSLSSTSIFDYWDPADAVQRVLRGAAINKLNINVNGDYHEFDFSGEACDLLDSASFSDGQGALMQFPAEPEPGPLNYAVVPGHLGQVWMGNIPERFFTLTGAEVKLDNSIDLRDREFGTNGPRCITAGRRNVSLNLSLYEQGNDSTTSLYQAARQRSPISVMFQLGQEAGQMFGIYMKGLVPEVPEFDDAETRLQWHFSNCRAQGTIDDELVIAFA